MINIEKVKTRKVDEDVQRFGEFYGGNHVALYQGFEKHPEIRDDRDKLEQLLSYSIRKRSANVAKRVLGRIRAIDKATEEAELNKALGVVPKGETLGCLG